MAGLPVTLLINAQYMIVKLRLCFLFVVKFAFFASFHLRNWAQTRLSGPEQLPLPKSSTKIYCPHNICVTITAAATAATTLHDRFFIQIQKHFQLIVIDVCTRVTRPFNELDGLLPNVWPTLGPLEIGHAEKFGNFIIVPKTVLPHGISALVTNSSDVMKK